MIPTEWFEVKRPDDGELVGYLRLLDEDFQAYDLLGRPVGSPLDFLAAEEALTELGISYLSGLWYLAPGRLDPEHPSVSSDSTFGESPRVVRILDVNRERATVSTGQFAVVGEQAESHSVPLPVRAGVLSPVPAEDLAMLRTIDGQR